MKKYKLKIVLSCGDDINFVKDTIEKIKSFNIPNYDINLISNENNSEEIKLLECENIKVYDGVFNEQAKNLSILKWEDSFIDSSYDLIFFIDKNVNLINNIFSSICEIYHKEKPTFGCAFPSSLNDDYSIFSSKFNILKNKENQFNLLIQDNGSVYNVMNGYRENKMGNLSDVFVTTYKNLIDNDWFDIQYETNVCYNDFTLKSIIRNQKCFCDNNSLATQNTFNNNELFNQDLNKLLQKVMSEQKLQNLIVNV